MTSTSRAEAMRIAEESVKGKPGSDAVWTLDDAVHRGWNVRMIRLARGSYMIGLLVSDIRFEPPVLMMLIKLHDPQADKYETRVLQETDPAQAMALIEGEEREIVSRDAGTILSREWLRSPGSEKWTSAKKLLRGLENLDMLTGEYRVHGET